MMDLAANTAPARYLDAAEASIALKELWGHEDRKADIYASFDQIPRQRGIWTRAARFTCNHLDLLAIKVWRTPSDTFMSKPLTKADAAARCGTSEKTIERSVKGGRLKAHKIGGRLIIFEDDLNAFLAQCANVPATPPARAGVQAV